MSSARYLKSFYETAAERLAEIDADPDSAVVSLEEALGDKGYRDFLALDPDDIPDDELFA